MAVAVTPGPCLPSSPPRFVFEVAQSGCGLIQYCRPPWQAVLWPARYPIPADFLALTEAQRRGLPAPTEVFLQPAPGRPALDIEAYGPALCQAIFKKALGAVTLGLTDLQRARAGLLEPRKPRDPRLARRSRPARAPRARRPPRPPREPRFRLAPRMRRTKRAKARPTKARKKTWYCILYWSEARPYFDVENDPFTLDEIKEIGRANPRAIIYPSTPGKPCGLAGQNACERQAEFFVRPLQQLLGWERPKRPELLQVFAERPVPAGFLQPRPLGPPPPPPAPPEPGLCARLVSQGRYDEARAICAPGARFFVHWITVTPPQDTRGADFSLDQLLAYLAIIQATPTSQILEVGQQ